MLCMLVYCRDISDNSVLCNVHSVADSYIEHTKYFQAFTEHLSMLYSAGKETRDARIVARQTIFVGKTHVLYSVVTSYIY
jgi:hypothetical protein